MVVRGTRRLLDALDAIKCARNNRTQATAERSASRIAAYLRRRVFPLAYRLFHSNLALGQFVSIAFTLLACLSSLAATVTEVATGETQEIEEMTGQTGRVVLDNDDVGEIIIPANDIPIVPANDIIVPSLHQNRKSPQLPKEGKASKQESKRSKESKKESKRKSKKKSAIDDIFG